jgi:hypothetical protein
VHDYILDITQDKVASKGDIMSKLDVATKLWESEIESEEFRLIVRGMPPYYAKDEAVRIVSKRRRDKHVDKNGA